VVLGSIVSPGVADGTKGSLTVKITNEAGAAVQGVAVNAASLTATTNASGCVVFGNLSAGTYPVTWSKPGYVDKNGNTVGGKSATVAGAANASISDSYDLAATIPLAVQGTDGTTTGVSWPSISLASAPNNVLKRFALTGTAINAVNLYPFASGYSVYAGNCNGNEPSQYRSAYYTENAAARAVPAPGATAGTTAGYLRQIAISATTASATNVKYRITPSMTGCTEGDTGLVTYSAGAVRWLPWGTYLLCVQGTISSKNRSGTATISNVPTGPVNAMAALAASVTLTAGTSNQPSC
jgi:hypothetical protein